MRFHAKFLLVVALSGFSLFLGRARGIEHDKPYGEPYALAGNRLVFTSWYFVKPGQLDWRDASGKSVYANEQADLDHGEATFECIDCPYGIRLVAEPAQRVGPVIDRVHPWEAMGISPDTVIADDGRFRCWGSCRDAEGVVRSCYFESIDGYHWERPALPTSDFEGRVAPNQIEYAYGAVFIDPSAKPEERYKTVKDADFDPDRFAKYRQNRPWSHMALETDPGRVHSIRAAVSPDGYQWTELPDSISVEPSDTQIVAYYDQALQKYVMFTRSYFVGPRAKGYPLRHGRWHQFTHRRAIGRSESRDFSKFPLSEVILETDNDMAPTDTYYTNCRTTIPGAPDHHLMFPSVYIQRNDTTRVELFTSSDSRVWHRAPSGPVLKTASLGEWDGGCIFARPNLVELPDGSWALPYTGYPYPHKFPRGRMQYDVGLAVWPKGRLMALEAPDEGAFTTVAFIPPGRKIRINATTEPGGSIRVEAANFNGQPLPRQSFEEAQPMEGNLYQTVIQWEDSDKLALEEGEPVVLRFQLNQAKIYGLDFE